MPFFFTCAVWCCPSLALAHAHSSSGRVEAQADLPKEEDTPRFVSTGCWYKLFPDEVIQDNSQLAGEQGSTRADRRQCLESGTLWLGCTTDIGMCSQLKVLEEDANVYYHVCLLQTAYCVYTA